jgi:hydroxysqualene dehydroxylase
VSQKVAVVGGGWAGLAAAIEATQRGHAVTLFEMAAQLGGRARRVDIQTDEGAWELDNGQHILIGAYTETLSLMRLVGADPQRAFLRTPLRLVGPSGMGLSLPPGAPALAFARGVLAQSGWRVSERLRLLAHAGGWMLRSFRCDAAMTVAQLTAALPAAVRTDLIDPLCVAALNTPSTEASATVFLRVLRDALFSGPGSADLLLPTWRLSALLPEPAAAWLMASGAEIKLCTRVTQIERDGVTWKVDGQAFGHVVLATPPAEASRLTATLQPAWAQAAAALRYEPIVTVYAQSLGTRLPEPMLLLKSDETQNPAQFVFDLGQLGGPEGLLAFVVSGAAPWVAQGADITTAATLAQAQLALHAFLKAPLKVVKHLTEKRATFRCTPALARPASLIAPGLFAAGDYVDGPYPASLEGAVRSGLEAARQLKSFNQLKNFSAKTVPPTARR